MALSKSVKDGLIFGLVGLMAGTAVGVIVASAYAVVKQGGKFNDVQGYEILDHAPLGCGTVAGAV